MYTDAFIKCGPDETAALLARLDTLLPKPLFSKEGLMALKKPLSFYEDTFYYDLTQVNQHPSKHFSFVVGLEKVFICNGDVNELLAFNQKYPLKIDRTNVLDYTRFYFDHVVGPHGLSRVIETVDDLQLKEEPSPTFRKGLHDKIVPLTLSASAKEGGYQARGTLLVEQTMFSTFITIMSSGEITVELGRVLADLLPTSGRLLEA